jgi:NAD(P)-dependent dehydrogenase (short-subunit alcohol dehydrogenase family)
MSKIEREEGFEMAKSDVFVITGGGGGIGVACARQLGKMGTLLLDDIDSARIKQAAAQLRSEGLRVETMVNDVSKEEDVRILTKTAASLGQLAGVVHTAGLSPRMAEWQRIFEVNLIGTARVLDTFLPLAGPGTAVVCLASMAAYMMPSAEEIDAVLAEPLAPDFFRRIADFIPQDPALPIDKSSVAYCLGKRGVIRLCSSKAPVWGSHGARIVSISPGLIDTPMYNGDLKVQPQINEMVRMAYQQRPGKPEEIANVVAFLISKEASYINGAELLVDGGVVATMKSLGQAPS